MDTLADWSRILSVLLVLAQGLLLWVLWSLRKQFVSRTHCDKRCDEHKDAQAELEKKQMALEQAQTVAPTAKDMASLTRQLGEMAGDIKALRATTEAQADAMKRIEHPLNLLLQHELHGGR